MPPAGFESAIPASERPQTHDLDRAAAGIRNEFYITFLFYFILFYFILLNNFPFLYFKANTTFSGACSGVNLCHIIVTLSANISRNLETIWQPLSGEWFVLDKLTLPLKCFGKHSLALGFYIPFKWYCHFHSGDLSHHATCRCIDVGSWFHHR